MQLLNGSFSNDLLIPPSIAGKYLRRYFYYSTLVAVGDSLKFLYKEGTEHTCTLVFIRFTSIIMNNQVTSSWIYIITLLINFKHSLFLTQLHTIDIISRSIINFTLHYSSLSHTHILTKWVITIMLSLRLHFTIVTLRSS